MIDWLFLFVDHRSKLELIIGEIGIGACIFLFALVSPIFSKNKRLIIEAKKIASIKSGENIAPLSLQLNEAKAFCFQYIFLSIFNFTFLLGYSFMGIIAFRDMPFVAATFFIFLALVLGWFYFKLNMRPKHKTDI
ncbi:MAG: hypothetical protein UT43_C0044G0001 [Parcubacteria group bacterium GW2011_GWC1_39_29]|nr:MAG: hypothetical protein UT43_C0044G0001 [Parcubacteria group bacterium GW2011_GWC1_39_29]